MNRFLEDMRIRAGNRTGVPEKLAGRGPGTPDEEKIISLLALDVGWVTALVTDLLTLSGAPPGLARGWEKTHNALVRDLFGNPFRPVVADPAWRTPTVVGIAARIYD